MMVSRPTSQIKYLYYIKKKINYTAAARILHMGEESTDQQMISNYQELAKTTLKYQNDLNALHKQAHPENAAKIAREIAAMNRELANANIQEAISGVRDSAKNYQTAVQLEKTGEHVGQVQKQILDRNKRILANLSADAMTAKRVATINQQHFIQARVVTEYVQLCSVFFCVAIVITFVFSLGPVRSFFKHPFAAMQIVLTVLLVVLVFIIVYRVVANRNHYRMLYQERVFPIYDSRIHKGSGTECPVVEEDTTTPPDEPAIPDDEPACPPVVVMADSDGEEEEEEEESA